MRHLHVLIGLIAAACSTPLPAQEAIAPDPGAATSPPPTAGVLGYYRQPALHGDTIVFAAEGDLWTVTTDGGVARRLTTHPGEETHPVISPDGKTLAFTGRYEGPTELYTMPLAGGLPTRRTFETDPSLARAWTPDGMLVYETRAYSGLPRPGLVVLDLETLTRAPLPLAYSSEAAFDESGDTTYFVRPAFHRNVTKRYTGGTARDVWKFEKGAEEAVELTGDWKGESHSPMWWGRRVYFVTDRDGTMNLWSMEEDGNGLRQHTHHSGFDVRSPSLDGGRIVYHHAADICLFDIASGATRVVPITLASDLDQLREKWIDDPMPHLEAAHLHPEGESVVLTSRGRVFVAPAKQGRLLRASRKSGVRFRDVVFLPDGKGLLGLSDESGELEFTRIPADGVGSDEPITDDGSVLRFRGHPSPDRRHVAYTDQNFDLWVLDLETKEQTRINEHREEWGDLAWSPDGRWLAYSMTALNTFRQIKIYDTREKTTTPLTSDRMNSSSIAWGPDGDFIYFLSDRNLRSLVSSPWGTRQPEPYFDRAMEIFEIALRPGLRSPFRPDDELYDSEAKERAEKDTEKDPEENPEKESKADSGEGEGAADDDGDAEEELTPVEIEPVGLAGRLKRVPVPAGNYRSLLANADALFFLSRESGPSPDTHLLALKIACEDTEPKTIVEKVASVQISLDGKKLLLGKNRSLYIIDAKPAKVSDLSESKVDLSGWSYSIDVREDWRQIFVDAWRLERDYFYDPGMHGVDWDATLARYLPLVDRVTTRDELSHLIGFFVGELSALHTSVGGGDLRRGEDRVSLATLGARLFRDPAAGGYRIDLIYQTDPDYPDERAPLAEPHLDIHRGDIIEAIDGVPVLEVSDLGVLLRDRAGRQVRIRVRSGGTGATPAGESRDLIVVPRGNELDLRYDDWEYTRRLRVDEQSEEAIGYVHLRAMGGENVTEWYRNFYPVFNRPGLIIDVRGNRGGNIDSWILAKLMRRAWMYWQQRTSQPVWNMQYAFRGHMVVLVDQRTASDGEAFADGFRRLGLGPVIGMRTWGGEIWLSSGNRLTDGGLARAPMSGVYDDEGNWLIEQVGCVPDIEIDNLPHATFLGSDAQLDAAIAYLLGEIEKDPRPVPPPPPFPDRSFDYREKD
jgi:tricorn protease